jgi:hypothetical protein
MERSGVVKVERPYLKVIATEDRRSSGLKGYEEIRSLGDKSAPDPKDFNGRVGYIYADRRSEFARVSR